MSWVFHVDGNVERTAEVARSRTTKVAFVSSVGAAIFPECDFPFAEPRYAL